LYEFVSGNLFPESLATFTGICILVNFKKIANFIITTFPIIGKGAPFFFT